MLKTQPFGGIFFLGDKENFSSFQTARNHVKEALNTTCAEVLGKKMLNQQKDWILMNKVQERKKAKQVLNVSKTRAAKLKAQLQYTMYESTHGSKAQHQIR